MSESPAVPEQATEKPRQKWRKLKWLGKLAALGITFAVGYSFGEEAMAKKQGRMI